MINVRVALLAYMLVQKNDIHLENEKSNVRWRNPEVTLEELIQSNQ